MLGIGDVEAVNDQVRVVARLTDDLNRRPHSVHGENVVNALALKPRVRRDTRRFAGRIVAAPCFNDASLSDLAL